MKFPQRQFYISTQISLKIIPKVTIDANMSAFVQVITWYLLGIQPFPESIVMKISDNI